MKQLGFEAEASPHEQAAREFDERNPDVWEWVVRFAFEAVAAGRARIGIASVWERIRWHVEVERRENPYALNNNFRAYYARKFQRTYPAHSSLFETRRLRSREWRQSR